MDRRTTPASRARRRRSEQLTGHERSERMFTLGRHADSMLTVLRFGAIELTIDVPKRPSGLRFFFVGQRPTDYESAPECRPLTWANATGKSLDFAAAVDPCGLEWTSGTWRRGTNVEQVKIWSEHENTRTTRDTSSRWCGYRFRAFQISSEGHRRAQSRVTNEKLLGESSEGRGSIRSSTSNPFARRSRTHSP